MNRAGGINVKILKMVGILIEGYWTERETGEGGRCALQKWR